MLAADNRLGISALISVLPIVAYKLLRNSLDELSIIESPRRRANLVQQKPRGAGDWTSTAPFRRSRGCPVRVLHILHHSLPQLTGYAVRSHRILQFQAGLGVEVAAVTSGREGYVQGDAEEFDGIAYHRTRPAGGLIADTRATARRALEVARSFEPDVIHAHSPWLCALAAESVGRKLRRPVVYEIRDFWEDASVAIGKFRQRSVRYLAARIIDSIALRRAERIVTISDAQRRDLIGRGVPAGKIVIAGNGVDADRFTPRAKPDDLVRRHNLAGSQVIGYIGSFLPYEGLEVLIRAFADVVRAHHDARLLIVGTGAEMDGLQRLANDVGVAALSVFTGRVPHDQIIDYYAALDIAVYPRLSNRTTQLTTPLKPLEAMAMAKPVIASDLPAMQELIVPGETGILCPPGDAAALAAACVDLLRRPDFSSRIGAAGRESVLATRTWEQTLAPYSALYAELAGSVAHAAVADRT